MLKSYQSMSIIDEFNKSGGGKIPAKIQTTTTTVNREYHLLHEALKITLNTTLIERINAIHNCLIKNQSIDHLMIN